jgi:phosphopantothenoylcysteine decarboxylase/phosphopantothenate--cysteine ligase
MLKNKNIIIGITGCIAAYKSCQIIRLLKKQGANVRVLATDAALQFITKLTLRTLSQHKVYHDLFEDQSHVDVEHISLARWADLVLIAPATANTIAKLAYGIADNLLTTVCLATQAPIMLAPAMNYAMWEHEATQNNLQQLRKRGVEILKPILGQQACGEIGMGKMQEAEICVKRVAQFLKPSLLQDKTIVITAGPTREPLDPIRFLSNASSGKMGYALAKAAFELGMQVKLISGPVAIDPPAGVQVTFIDTAAQMYDAVMSSLAGSDILISVAAVADYRANDIAKQKIKKHKNMLQLSLQRTPDILKAISTHKSRPFLVGFAAETENLVENAFKKLTAKNLDMIIANEVGQDQVFGQQDSELLVITKGKRQYSLSKKPKSDLAFEIFDILASVMQ